MAFVLGAVAALVAAVLVFVTVAIAADAGGWESFGVRMGPLVFLEFEQAHGSTSTTLGAGVFALALGAGALNAAGAAVVRRRE